MTTKFEVMMYNVEFKCGADLVSASDILAQDYMNNCDPVKMFSSTDEAEAMRFYLDHTEDCETRRFKASTGSYYINADVLVLEQNEYDEDDDFDNGCIIKDYAEAYGCEEDE